MKFLAWPMVGGGGVNLVGLIKTGVCILYIWEEGYDKQKSVLADKELVFGRWAYKWERLDHKRGTYKI